MPRPSPTSSPPAGPSPARWAGRPPSGTHRCGTAPMPGVPIRWSAGARTGNPGSPNHPCLHIKETNTSAPFMAASTRAASKSGRHHRTRTATPPRPSRRPADGARNRYSTDRSESTAANASAVKATYFQDAADRFRHRPRPSPRPLRWRRSPCHPAPSHSRWTRHGPRGQPDQSGASAGQPTPAAAVR